MGYDINLSWFDGEPMGCPNPTPLDTVEYTTKAWQMICDKNKIFYFRHRGQHVFSEQIRTDLTPAERTLILVHFALQYGIIEFEIRHSY